MDGNKQVKVLFVCMGNICRSPTGEGVFKHYVAKQGYADRIKIDSAGTISYHAGDPADARMRAASIKRDYHLDSIARQVTAADIKKFNLIISMDQANQSDLEQLAGSPREHIRLLGSFLSDAVPGHYRDVPDPYYGGEQGFEEVLDMIEQACPAMLEHCRQLLD